MCGCRNSLLSRCGDFIPSWVKKKEDGGRGLSSKTVHEVLGVLHKALDNAVKWNYVSRNVCDVVSPPRLIKPEMQAFSMEQARKLLEHVRGHRLEVLLTLALRWADIDFEHQTARIHRTVDYIHHGYVETEPKTMAGRRTIVQQLHDNGQHLLPCVS